jgi:hypothetical protein
MLTLTSLLDRVRPFWLAVSVCSVLLLGLVPAAASALGSQENPQSGSVGLEGKVDGPPPSTPPSITVPGNGQTFTSTPIRVAGLCTGDLLVKIFSNNVFVGSTVCSSGSYSLQVDLFSGANDLVAIMYDALDQASPDSNTVRVTFNDAQFAQFGTRVTLSSTFARKGAAPGQTLTWPITLSGGASPYAISVDWGDGKAQTLLTRSDPGNFDITHVYDSAGVYNIVIKATDGNGTTAYLQLVGVGTGQVSGKNGTNNTNTSTSKTRILWEPLLVLIPMILIAFWLGKRHELFTIRKRIEDNRGQ